MRLSAIEKPQNIIVKIAYWVTKRKFGKVFTPLKVIYSRKPELLFLTNSIDKYQTNKLSISDDLRLILKAYIASLNGCEFCNDLALASALNLRIGTDKFQHLSTWEKSKNIFSAKELAILRFASEYAHSRKISDDCFRLLQLHFNDIEIIDIISQNAIENYFNALNIPLEIGSDELAKIVCG